MQNEKAMTDANLDAAHRCTCGQSVHGNGHEPGCPLPVKSEPQVGTGTALATRPFVAVNISRMETLIDTAFDCIAYEQECKEQMQIACRLLRDAYSALEIDRDDPRFNQGVRHVVDMLARTIGAEDWFIADGSEDYDCDLRQTLLNILAAKGLYDKDEGTYAHLPTDQAELALPTKSAPVISSSLPSGESDPAVTAVQGEVVAWRVR